MIAIERWSAASAGMGSDFAGMPVSERMRVIAKALSSAQDAVAVSAAS